MEHSIWHACQCDQMSIRLFFQYLAFYINEICPMAYKIVKLGSNVCQILKSSQRVAKNFYDFAKVAKFCTNLVTLHASVITVFCWCMQWANNFVDDRFTETFYQKTVLRRNHSIFTASKLTCTLGRLDEAIYEFWSNDVIHNTQTIISYIQKHKKLTYFDFVNFRKWHCQETVPRFNFHILRNWIEVWKCQN